MISEAAIALCLLDVEYAGNEEAIKRDVRLAQAIKARLEVLAERQAEIEETRRRIRGSSA